MTTTRGPFFSSAKPSGHLFTKEEEINAFTEYQTKKNPKAREAIIVGYANLVAKMARQYSRYYGVDVEELMSEGMLGVMRAMETFDLSKGFRFSTYAVFWIKSYLRQYIFCSRSIVRRAHQIGQVWNQLGQAVSDSLNTMQKIFVQDVSVDQPLGDSSSDDSILDKMADENSNFEEDVLKRESLAKGKALIEQVLSGLNEREQEVIRRRYMVEGDKKVPYDVIAEEMGLSAEGVRQIEKRVLNKFKQEFKKNAYS